MANANGNSGYGQCERQLPVSANDAFSMANATSTACIANANDNSQHMGLTK